MRSIGVALLISTVFVPVIAACEIQTGYSQPPQYGVQAQVVTPPPPTAQVDVQAGDPNAQQVDPNAQAQVDPNAPQADPNDQDPSALSDFKDALAPYGQWADDPQYGTIWLPSPGVVGADFTPYQSAGHWVYDTDYTWVSDYDWGWAPFHYGRWFQYPGRGWAWVPGKEYAGAWVTWRNSDDASVGAVGWAPTAPAFYWRNNAAVIITQPWYTPTYVYVGTTDLFAPTIRERIIRDPVRIRGFETRTRVYEPRGGFVGGSGGIRMRVRGPEPTRMGFRAEALPRAPANNAGLIRAQQFSRVRPASVGGGVSVNRTVTPTHPPIDTRTQGHVESHPQQVGQVQPAGGGAHGGVVEHPQQVQQVQQQQHQQIQTPPANTVRRVTPPPTGGRHR
jgi:hypothetical protein